MKSGRIISIQCNCGGLQGSLVLGSGVNRCRCYCASCQAFASYLKIKGAAGDIVDTAGGSDITQMLPSGLSFTSGMEHLACLRLRENGLLRWYASCCHTPIGNTLRTHKLSFVGLIHSCVNTEQQSLDEIFGPVRSQASTSCAIGDNKPESFGVKAGIFRFIRMMLKARLSGSYKINPFFDTNSGDPVAVPQVLAADQLAQLLNAPSAT